MNSLVAQRPPEDPFIFVPEIDRRYDKFDRFPSSQPINTTQQLPQYIPLPYPVPSSNNNQGSNQGGFNLARALGAAAGYMGMAFGDPAFSPGLKLTPELAGRYGGIRDLLYRPNQDKAEVQLLAGSFNMPIDPNAHRQNTKTQKIYNKGMRTDNPYEKEMFLKRTGVQLPRV